MPEDAATSRWRSAFAECVPTLEALGRSGDEQQMAYPPEPRDG